MNFWDKISNVGIDDSLSPEDRIRIRIFNRMIFYAFGMNLVFIAWLPFVHLEVLAIILAVITCSHFLLYALIRKRKVDLAGIIFNVAYGLYVNLIALILPEAGLEVFTIAFGIVPFFILKNRTTSLILLGFWLVVFFALIPLEAWVGYNIVEDPALNFAFRKVSFVFITVFVFFSVFHFKQTNHRYAAKLNAQRQELTIQRDALEEAHADITASIKYAKRIQSAVLPPDKFVKDLLVNSFVLYRPKDFVAGDFYWLEKKDDKILLAAADCTGHGVPGAMVSVICNNGLNRSVREHGLTNPAKILDKTRDIVVQEFEKSEEEVKDGMDIALCSIDNNLLEFAGANNPFWLIRTGTTEIVEIKGDKQPIGKFSSAVPFKSHSVTLHKGDTFYIFSDGYADQFGGEKGKKFSAKRFKSLLLSIQNKDMTEQKEIIHKTFETWKGNLEQLDDVCIIGVRI